MKTGRNGEDPKKPKAQSEVNVTAKKPVEPPQKQYTWDDVAKNEAIKERNKAAKQQYESDVAGYNKAMKLYKEGPESINDTTGGIKTSGKLKEGGVATFKSMKKEDSYSAEKMNRDIESKIKKGEIVSIDDPSLDPTTRRLIAGANVGTKEGRSDIFGTTGKRYVPKGTKYTSYKEIYGEDYNPEEYQAASKAGKLSEYNEKKGYEGRTFKPVNLTQYESYKTPEQAKEPTYEKEESINPSKLPIPKMEKKNKSSDLKPLRMSESKAPAEKADWEEPSRTKTISKTRLKGASNANAFERGPLKSARVVDLKRSGTKEKNVRGYEKEAKMAKAYFSGYEGKSKFDIEGTSEERGAIGKLKADKASLKEGIKAVRKGTAAPSTLDKSERIQGLRAAKKDVKSDIKQAKLASKYVSKLGQEYTGVREGQELRSTGKIKTFTPTAMAGFSGSKQDTYSPDANFKNQMSNATNRNTISSKIDAVEPRRSRSQRREERSTQRSVMKNLPK